MEENNLLLKAKLKKGKILPNTNLSNNKSVQDSNPKKYETKLSPSNITVQEGRGFKYIPEVVKKWSEPKYVAGLSEDGHYGYNEGVIHYNPNDKWENIENPQWLEHERYHHFLNITGRDNPNKRNEEVRNQVKLMVSKNPALQFIPKEKLISGSSTILPDGRKSFYGAEDLIYLNPNTIEGKAHLYEKHIEGGGKSILPPLDIKKIQLENIKK
jgi:hypothetical protein